MIEASEAEYAQWRREEKHRDYLRSQESENIPLTRGESDAGGCAKTICKRGKIAVNSPAFIGRFQVRDTVLTESAHANSLPPARPARWEGCLF